MTLVTNTGPLIALAGIGRLDLLQKLYSRVLVPQPVHEEMLASTTSVHGQAAYRQTTWLEVKRVPKLGPALVALLDRGEASVITLALSQRIPDVLLDEQKARKVARNIYGLTVMGSMRVLVSAKQQGYFEKVEAAVNEMRANGYWLHEGIVQRVLQEAGEIP